MNALTHHAHELAQRIGALSPVDQIGLLVAALIAIPWLISMFLTLARISIGGFQRLSRRRRNPLTRKLANGAPVPVAELLQLASEIEPGSALRSESADPYEAARINLGLSPGFNQGDFMLRVMEAMTKVRFDLSMSDEARAIKLRTLIEAGLIIEQARGWSTGSLSNP